MLFKEVVAMPDAVLRGEYDAMRSMGAAEVVNVADRERFFMVLAEFAMRGVGSHIPEALAKPKAPRAKPVEKLWDTKAATPTGEG